MTREEAIRTLEEHKIMFQHDFGWDISTIKALDMAISALSDCDKMQEISLDLAFENDELINKSRWIPVSERLPEKKVKDYLACCEDGYVATIMYDNGRWLINGNNVIAWMPLPDPYKPEKPETCKGCLEPCIMYEPDMRACKKKVKAESEGA